jgi:ribosome-binding ATPase YchF (GTP1/OBG family)
MIIGLVGGPNKGKTTLFNAMTCGSATVADYPFTTIDPNKGVAFANVPCPCRLLEVKCSPRNSKCENGVRRVPVNVVDVAGLVPGASLGKGMGSEFLSDVSVADVLVVVADASGRTDSEGRAAAKDYDVANDVEFIEGEMSAWLAKSLGKALKKLRGKELVEFADGLQSLGFTRDNVLKAVEKSNLPTRTLDWTDDDLPNLARVLLHESKPRIIAANKMDAPTAQGNYEQLKRELSPLRVIPVSADTELALQRGRDKGLLDYDGAIVKPKGEVVNPQVANAVEKISRYLGKWGDTGVQKIVDTAVFTVSNMIVVYPVEDETHYSDHFGRVLPDAILLPRGSTALDLAAAVHTDLAKHFLYAVDAFSKQRVSRTAPLSDGAVIKIVAAK